MGRSSSNKIVDVLEAAVDAGETNIRHLVQFAEVLHHELPQVAAFDLRLEVGVHVILHLDNDVVDLGVADGSFPARLLQALAKFVAIEGDPGAVLLNHHDPRPFHVFAGREPPLASQTLPPAADGASVLARPRIEHTVVVDMTVGALHDRLVLRIPGGPSQPGPPPHGHCTISTRRKGYNTATAISGPAFARQFVGLECLGWKEPVAPS